MSATSTEHLPKLDLLLMTRPAGRNIIDYACVAGGSASSHQEGDRGMTDEFAQGPVDFRRVDIPAFVKRLVRYYETSGKGDWRYAAETIEQQNAEIERLCAENAKLRARVAELEKESNDAIAAAWLNRTR